MKYNVGLLKGDGIGPEIVDSAVRVLEKIGQKYGHEFVFTPYLIGGAAIDACGEPLPKETVNLTELLSSLSNQLPAANPTPVLQAKRSNSVMILSRSNTLWI